MTPMHFYNVMLCEHFTLCSTYSVLKFQHACVALHGSWFVVNFLLSLSLTLLNSRSYKILYDVLSKHAFDFNQNIFQPTQYRNNHPSIRQRNIKSPFYTSQLLIQTWNNSVKKMQTLNTFETIILKRFYCIYPNFCTQKFSQLGPT